MTQHPHRGPRIPPIPPRDWSPVMKTATAPLTPATPRPPGQPRGLNILGTFAHHPDLATAFWVFNGYLLNRSRLSQRQIELAVLRVAHVRGSAYEWHQHLFAARACGITEQEIEAIRDTDRRHPWPAVDGAILAAVDELIADGTVAEETWSVLSTALDHQQVLDLVYTVGAYVAIAMMLGVAGTPLDADLLAATSGAPLPESASGGSDGVPST
ncbi:MAG: carboxymuconolactone decarboxylase family protein [Acidimicrobiales bacterium]